MSLIDLALAIAIWVAGLGGLVLVVFGLLGAAWNGSSLVDPPLLPAGLVLWVVGGLLIRVGSLRSKRSAHDG
ncbi:MAG: hypothetical protein DRQ55_19100 [Planctomycetota bacterium]|nr:MAG: hypothetical protein DRQ55_19100 [Planctomycetota bacterium]